jgi:hypothetical protein
MEFELLHECAGLDVMISKDGRGMVGMCVQHGDGLFIRHGGIFKEIPVDYTIKTFTQREFLTFIKDGGYTSTSCPNEGDKIVWFSDDGCFPLERTIVFVIHTRGGDALVVEREGVKHIVFVKKSAIFRK